MDLLQSSVTGLVNFSIYFGLSLVLLLLFKLIYSLITPYDEWALIKENNTAAATAFVGAILGFSLALASAVSNSVSIFDFVIWAVVALLAQLIAFLIVRLFMPKIVQRINKAELSAGIVLAGISIAIGVINAACMSY